MNAQSQLPLWLQFRSEGLSAHQILNHFGILSPPIPVEELARRMGISLVFSHTLPYAGVVTSNSKLQQAQITVRATDSRFRQRFTIAHEIGHLLLHPLGEEHRDTNYAGDPKEAQANGFGANLLMPLWMVDIAAKSLGHDSLRLSRVFEVSQAAMAVRLERIFGITHGWDDEPL